MKKNMVLTFICACIPGCGQMYMGYMKRGASLMFWFCAISALAALTYTEVILFALPVVWAYAFFDTFNLRNLSPQQQQTMGDFFIPSPAWLGKAGDNKWLENMRFGRIAGWVLIAIGVLVVYGNFWDLLYSYTWNLSPELAAWISRLPALVIAVVVIVVGLRMLRTTPKQADANRAKEDDNEKTEL